MEGHALLGHADPALERLVLGEELEQDLVRGENVLGVARERHPTEGSLAFAEERADVLGYEAFEVEGILEAGFLGVTAQVVAVVEGVGAARLELDHELAVVLHGVEALALVILRIGSAQG